MNRKLKRIEQTLHQLERSTGSVATAPELENPEPSISFDMPRRGTGVREIQAPPVPMLDRRTQLETQFHQPVPPIAVAVEETPLNLPRVNTTLFTSHRNGVNPDLAINLLQDMLGELQQWRTELKIVLKKIERLYHEGPIVDGWLESSSEKMTSTATVLRHESIDRLMDYVEEICEDPGKTQPEYRLCGLNADGKTWSCPCPPDQLASISIAISRHQKLQGFLSQKLQLETYLTQAAESLVKVHGQIHGNA
ncbi:MAG: hypothetical protein HC860_15915 [Alkalinema sp. RU_4_3]|nr:hypothetical protein [Alkalinema sp. RU_4_3]